MSKISIKLKPLDIEFAKWDSYKVQQMIDGKQGGGSREEILKILEINIINEIKKNLPTLIEQIVEREK